MTAAHRPLTRDDLVAVSLHRLGRQVLTFDTVDSTNAALLRQAAELPDGTLAAAEMQTAGRGRLGRRWESPRGASVMLSVLLHEPVGSPLLPLGGLLGALAACEAVEQATACTPAVRWPNDVVIAGRKVAGVLAETTGSGPTRALVIGVGINCLQHAGHFSPALAGRATSLDLACPGPVARAAVAAALVQRLDVWLADGGRADRVAALRTTWRRRCVEIGARVTLEHDGRSFTGTMLDIDDDGNLIVELDRGGRRHFVAAVTTQVW